MQNVIRVVLLWMGWLAFPVYSNPIRIEGNNTDQVLQYVRSYLPLNPLIVEAGAFDGSDTLRLALFWKEGKVYAFEPVPELFKKLQKKIQRIPNARAYQRALSDKNGITDFYLSVVDTDPRHVSASSSLLPPKEHLIKTPELSFPWVIKVQTTTLDKWAKQENIDHVDFLWLDMQGFELHMLRESQIARNVRALWIEVTFIEAYAGQYLFKDIFDWMISNGFELVATDFNLQCPEHWFGNALFINKK